MLLQRWNITTHLVWKRSFLSCKVVFSLCPRHLLGVCKYSRLWTSGELISTLGFFWPAPHIASGGSSHHSALLHGSHMKVWMWLDGLNNGTAWLPSYGSLQAQCSTDLIARSNLILLAEGKKNLMCVTACKKVCIHVDQKFMWATCQVI